MQSVTQQELAATKCSHATKGPKSPLPEAVVLTILHGTVGGAWGGKGGIPGSLHLGLGLLQLLLGFLLSLLGCLQVSRQRLLPLLGVLQLHHNNHQSAS